MTEGRKGLCGGAQVHNLRRALPRRDRNRAYVPEHLEKRKSAKIPRYIARRYTTLHKKSNRYAIKIACEVECECAERADGGKRHEDAEIGVKIEQERIGQDTRNKQSNATKHKRVFLCEE